VNSGWRRVLAAVDAPRIRLAFACVVAAAAWVLFLAHFARLFVMDERPPPVPETIEMKWVEIAPPEPEHTVPARSQAAERASLPHSVSKPQPSRRAQPVVRRDAIEPAKQANVPQSTAPLPQAEAPAAPPSEAPTAAKTASASDASRASSSAGTAQARLLAQPLPVLPDDLREVAYRAEAVARFDIHADGSTEVELVKSTPNPRLNQILLEALHKWRFVPAMENGRPVDSQRDVRVHFNVS
jgi:periplasmic protein TonB